MTKKTYKIIEIIGILFIIFLTIKLFPYIKNILVLIFKIILPFLISYTIAFAIEPLIEKLENIKIKRKVAVIIISIVLFIIIFIFFRYLVPIFINRLEELLKILPKYFEQFSNYFDKISKKYDVILNKKVINIDQIYNYLSLKMDNFVVNLSVFIQKVFSYIIVVIIIPILTIYFMNDYKNIELFVKNYLIKKQKNEIYDVLSKSKTAIRQYFKGMFIVIILLTFATTITFYFLKIDYPLLFGFIIGVTDIIPYLGPYIGGAIVSIFVLVSRPEKLIFVIISIVILQLIESNFLVPKIQSKTLKTNPILVILSVAFFGEIMGIFGMLIAVPLEKIVEIIVNSYIKNKKI